ncbi:hypothetical protein BT63DRAFT_272104 [Microthyrium microscopicum]|uniref:Uncharacterized protein n=1 Tax=Microthyrium microscopicum TaxID=703497 RepID=A0A6A6U9H1_9PEZI|nr:hypothetical protein BT63DRAFT_272104 [Microthyrium microscopicum]
MSAPLAKGLIIAASIVVAAGLAIYENEQVRLWLDEHRRRIAIALYSLGDGINPNASQEQSPQQEAEMAELNRKRRNEIVTRNREELIRKAQEEGVAVDLDQLTALGILERETASPILPAAGLERERSGSNTTFDGMVGHDGKLKRQIQVEEMSETPTASGSSFQPGPDEGMRHRGAGARGFAAGAGSYMANPFASPFDDDAHVLFDHNEEQENTVSSDPSTTIRAVSPRPDFEPHILDEQTGPIDIPVYSTEESDIPTPTYKTDDELEAEIQEAIRLSLTETPVVRRDTSATIQPDSPMQGYSTPMIHSPASDDSLYRPASPRFRTLDQSLLTTDPSSLTASSSLPADGSFLFASAPHSADGTRTPTTVNDDAFSTISSNPDLEMVDARSEADTNDSFSVVGASTPGSWSEVDSDSETEAVNGSSHVQR